MLSKKERVDLNDMSPCYVTEGRLVNYILVPSSYDFRQMQRMSDADLILLGI